MAISILASILVFSVIILVHELGHFLAARYVGIDVQEFAIGFGPKLAGFTNRGTNFSVRLFPLGGYVKMLGEEEGFDSDNVASYQNKTPWQRMLVIAAGPIMNFLLAILLFVIIFGAFSIYQVDEPIIGSITPGLPAEQAGLAAGDKILAIDAHEMDSWNDVVNYIRAGQGEAMTFLVQRDGQTRELEVVPRMGESGYLEIGIGVATTRLPIGASIKAGIMETLNLTKSILVTIGQIFTRQIPADDLTGPIGIVYYVGQAARVGLVNVLFLAALISVNLGLFNLLPIPALDGSKLVFLGIEIIRRKPLDPNKENLVHLVGFALLISLMIIVMYRDILRFIL